MPDMEKLISGLKWCGNARGCNWGCPYWDQFDLDSDGKLGCIHTMQLDALTLLEPDEVVPIEDDDYIWVCGNCGEEVYNDGELHDNYCANCGKKLKWQEGADDRNV